jgi:hypothetical protein
MYVKVKSLAEARLGEMVKFVESACWLSSTNTTQLEAQNKRAKARVRYQAMQMYLRRDLQRVETGGARGERKGGKSLAGGRQRGTLSLKGRACQLRNQRPAVRRPSPLPPD